MLTESLSEVLMSTMSLTVVFVCGLVPRLGPLWSPSCVLVCVLSGRPCPQIQAQVWSHLEPLKWVKSPFGLGKSPSGCVCGLSSQYFIISYDQYFIIFLNPNSSWDHYILASQSSFLLIVLLSLLVLVCFWFVESNSALQVLRWSFWLVCGWRKLALFKFLVSSSNQEWSILWFLKEDFVTLVFG